MNKLTKELNEHCEVYFIPNEDETVVDYRAFVTTNMALKEGDPISEGFNCMLAHCHQLYY